jgi:hypothetical protein
MKPVDQTTFGEEKGNCFSACVASILEISIEEVPFFMGPGAWWPRFQEWLEKRDYYPLSWSVPEKDQKNMAPYGVHILSGKSPRDIQYPEYSHAVVACGSEIIHDPHPSRDGIESFDTFILIVKGTNKNV